MGTKTLASVCSARDGRQGMFNRAYANFSIPEKPKAGDSLYVKRLWRDLFGEQTQEDIPRPATTRARRGLLVAGCGFTLAHLIQDDRLNLIDWDGPSRDPSRFLVTILNHILLATEDASSVYGLLSVDHDFGPITRVARSTGTQRQRHHIVLGLNNGDVQLWDFSCQQLLRTFQGLHSTPVCSFSWHDGNVLTSDGFDALITNTDIRDRPRGDPLFRYRGHTGGVYTLIWSPSCCGTRKLASGGADGAVYIWDLRSNLFTQRIEDRPMAVKTLAWYLTRDTSLGLCGSEADHGIKFWDVDTGAMQNSVVNVGLPVQGLAWKPDGRELVSCGKRMTVMEYPSLTKLDELPSIHYPIKEIISTAQSPEGGKLSILYADKKLIVWYPFGYQPDRGASIPFSNVCNTYIR